MRPAAALFWAELVILVVLAPLALFPTPARFPALLAIPAIWFVRALAGRRAGELPPPHFFLRTPLDGVLLLLAGMILVSLYATHDIGVSLPKIAGLIFGIGVYYAVVEALANRRRLAWGVGVYLGLGAALAGVALVGTQWIPKSPAIDALTARLPAAVRGWPGAEAGFQPNEVAGALLWFAPLALSLCAAALWGAARRNQPGAGEPDDLALRGWPLAAALVALILTGGTLLLTQSRGGLIGLGAGVLVMLMCLGRRGQAAALLAALAAAAGKMGAARLGAVLFGAEKFGAIGSINLAARVETWSRAIYAIEDFPLTGVGLNTFRQVVHVLYPLFLLGSDYDLGHAHNHLLQAALDLGLPGLVAYMALWLLAGFLLVRAWRQTQEFGLRALALGLGGSLAAYFVYGLADTVALGAKPGVAFWFLLALCVGVWRLSTPADAAGGKGLS
jgi:O-Antigen ligase